MALYLSCLHDPQQALPPRVMYLCESAEAVVGYIGGHLTERYECDGELQYLYVAPQYRRTGVASEMLRLLARWFDTHDASRICVDVEPDNHRARGFYASHGANYLNSHWLVWPDLRQL
jgi:ribosomal protein S18 acetylase RimI-like enzyme